MPRACASLTFVGNLVQCLGGVGPPPRVELGPAPCHGQALERGLGMIDAELAFGAVDGHATLGTILRGKEGEGGGEVMGNAGADVQGEGSR